MNTPRIAKKRSLSTGHPALLESSQTASEGSNGPRLPYIEEIHRRTNTLTSLLKEILDYRPRPHWD